jgi:tetratricopeptide (TPR) repeat protein
VSNLKKISRDQQKGQGPLRLGLILLGAILVLTSLVYMPSMKNEVLYGWDDGLYLEDAHLRNFETSSVTHFFSDFYLGMYQPLPVLSLAIDKQFYGDKASGYHFTNLFLHLLNIVLVFFFIYFLTRKINLALLVSLLFSIHPMHVEAVGWIAARGALLFTVFYLSALIFYLRYLDKLKWQKLAITFLFFVLACFSKSMAVTLPLVLLAVDYFRDRKFTRASILEKLPFFALSIVFGIISVRAAGAFGHIENLSSSYNFIDRIFLFSYGVAFYLFKAIVPVNLSAIYSFPLKEGSALPLEYYLSILVFPALYFLVLYLKKFRKETIFGLLFFLFSISVVLPFYWSRIFIAAERYSYLTYLGLYLLIAWGIDKLYDKGHLKLRRLRPYFTAALVIYAGFYIVTTVQRGKVWKNTETLLTDVVEKPHSGSTHSYGYFYRANYFDMTMEFERALADYDQAISLNPGFILAYNNRGIVKGMNREFAGAVQDFTKAVELKPDYADAYYNRGLANYQLGNKEQACQDWIKADRLGSPNALKFIQQNCSH